MVISPIWSTPSDCAGTNGYHFYSYPTLLEIIPLPSSRQVASLRGDKFILFLVDVNHAL